mgnify:CR=1 FL=1
MGVMHSTIRNGPNSSFTYGRDSEMYLHNNQTIQMKISEGTCVGGLECFHIPTHNLLLQFLSSKSMLLIKMTHATTSL